MSSWFDSEVYRRRQHTPWAAVKMLAFCNEMAFNETEKEHGIPLDKPRMDGVTIHINYRHDVSSGHWYEIEFTASDGQRHSASSQEFDLMLWRAAQIELNIKEKIEREERKNRYDLRIGKVCRTPYDPSGLVEIVEIVYAPCFGKDMATVRYLENHPHGYPKDSLGCYILDELREEKTASK